MNDLYWHYISNILAIRFYYTGTSECSYWHILGKVSIYTGEPFIIDWNVLATSIKMYWHEREGTLGGAANCAGLFIKSITDTLSLWRCGHDSLKIDTAVCCLCMHSTHTRHQSIVERQHCVAGHIQPYN